MGGPVPDLRIWDGSAWVQHQPIGSDGTMARIHQLKVSPDGAAWWPQMDTGEAVPSVPLSMTATAVSKSQINLSWAKPSSPGDMSGYKLYRNGALISSPALAATSYSDTGLASSTGYTYALYGITPGGRLGPSASASATTQAGIVDRSETRTATRSGSYNGSNNNRNVAEVYCGYYSGTNGQQKSVWWFDVPSDLRGCYSLQKVEMSVYVAHHYYGTGGKFGVVVHHGNYSGGFPATFPGSTGIFGEFAANKGTWLGGSQWVDITNYTCPGRTTVREEFRTNGAWGLGLAAPSTSLNYYGYGSGPGQSNPPQIRFTYQISS